MSVRVSKPAFNLRSKLNELDRPVGVFGNQVLATENRYDASKLIGGGRKNVLINGDFKISQRGTYTSATAVTDDAYYLDRWKMRESGTAITITHNKDISITEAGGDGIKTNSAKIDITSSASGYWALRQIVEDYAAVSGQTVTFSCWVRGVGPKVFFRLWSIGNIGHGHALTEDWQLYTETFSLPAFTQAADSSNGCVITIGNYAEANVYNHTNDWCELALFQVEIGRSPTPFEFRTEAEELALCQRYYQQIGPASSSARILFGAGNGTARIRGMQQFVPEMRIAPTVSVDTSSENFVFYSFAGGAPSYTSVNGVSSTTKNFTWDFNTSTHNQAGEAFDVKGSGAFITLAAEL